MLNEYINHWLSIQGVKQIIELFERNGNDIRFIGGCVRDAILGNISSDIDFAINCTPDTTVKLLRKNNINTLEYGKKYGTVTAVIGTKNFEITSLREDINQSGRYTEVKFTTNWEKDAFRRDFSFNAININSKGKIEDYFNGIDDLRLQQVKFIGDIEKRIKEDYLRILRYFRFLGLFSRPNLIEGYEQKLYSNLPELRKHVSNDRIRNEILKFLKNKYKMNSLMDVNNPAKLNVLINTINKWWIKDQYKLGLQKCMNQINLLIMEQS